MLRNTSVAPVACISDPERAAVVLKPLRLDILESAREPASATEIARRLGEPRQKVNYHVRALAEAGFLEPAEQRRRGNLIEQRYRAAADSWILTREVLASLGSDDARVADRESADHLLALTARAQSELARSRSAAEAAGKRLATLSLAADLSFTDPERRAAFARDLRDAVADVVARWASPSPTAEEAAGARPYRLVLGCYPVPPDENEKEEEEARP